MGYLRRRPDSNDPSHEQSNRLPSTSDLVHETARILAGKARRCVLCRCVTDNEHLDENRLCPHCSQSPKNWITERP